MRTVFCNEEVPGRIHAMLPFLAVGKLPDGTRRWSGHSGPPVSFGHLPRRFHDSARSAVYVVYSYGTPIAWVLENEYDPRNPYWYEVPDIGYSPSTGQHQMVCMEAWADHMLRQGTYRRWPAPHREVVRVPGNAEVYGRIIRARHGGVDGVRPGEVVGSRTSAYEGVSSDAMHWDGPTPDRAHP